MNQTIDLKIIICYKYVLTAQINMPSQFSHESSTRKESKVSEIFQEWI